MWKDPIVEEIHAIRAPVRAGLSGQPLVTYTAPFRACSRHPSYTAAEPRGRGMLTTLDEGIFRHD